MWDLRNTRESGHFEVGVRQAANKLSFDPSGRSLAVACNTGFVKFVNVLEGGIKSEIQLNDDSCQAVLFDKSGEYLVASGNGMSFIISLLTYLSFSSRWNLSSVPIKSPSLYYLCIIIVCGIVKKNLEKVYSVSLCT